LIPVTERVLVAAARVKPRLRGVLHEVAFFVAIPLGIVVGLTAPPGRAALSVAIFAGSVAAMFGASALYHCPTWTPTRRAWMRRLDHVGIFGLIAGTYTPFGLLVLTGSWRIGVLAVVWGGALVAIVLKLVYTSAPRWVSAAIALGLGWVAIVVYPQILSRAGLLATALVSAGGLCYTVGAVAYARRRPDPFPAVFGYHELFHALVIAAVAFQYAAVALVVF
jgi:hemolysin III